ncbi:MAG: ABC transporter ATP-binding protein [Bifidobacteriaceae bacterium]|jgi:ABC-2 type transport system ATP-binding protein|nr:ABC transporter ATP-binding protein [Bifidobacteriaceae bacterium]
MNTPPVIAIRGLVKTYPGMGRPAVDGIDLEIARGETFALLGPNGAGKSTTVEILEGFRAATAGTVQVLGANPARGGPEWKARIGVVLQDALADSVLTVREELDFHAALYPKPLDTDAVLADIGLADKAKARVTALSGGQRRRLDVALAIIGRPELLFLDEPTTGFDPQARRAFWELIRGLGAQGATILLTTHYLEEAAALANRAAVIDRGRLIATGTMADLGGPQAHVPAVRWTDPDGAPREERTTEPGRLVARLVSEQGGEPAGLTVTRPTVEDVYLGLIGRDREEALA